METELKKYQILIEDLENNQNDYIKMYVNSIVLENIGYAKTVARILDLMKDRY